MKKSNEKRIKQRVLKFIWASLPSISILLLIGLSIFLTLKGTRKKEQIKLEKEKAIIKEQSIPRVIVQEVQGTTIEDKLNLPGVISAWEDLVIQSEVNGVIIDLQIKEGDIVKKGQILAGIDKRDYENRVAQAEAAFNLAKLEYERFLKLSKVNATSKAHLDASLARLKETEAALAQAKLDLERTTIKSPIKGYINRLDAKVGLLVNRADPIAQILDTDTVKVEIDIPEADIHAVQKITQAWVTVDALGGEKFLGSKIFLSRQPETFKRAYTLKLAVKNPYEKLRPGMFSRVELIKNIYENAISIPLYAVISKGDEKFVYIANDNQAHSRRVELGILAGWRIQITSGLSIGDKVIIVGHRGLEDEQKIIIQQTIFDPTNLKEELLLH